MDHWSGFPPDRYTTQSLCIGAVTTTASVAPMSKLKAIGLWSSSAYEHYLRPEAQDFLDAQKL